MADEKKDKTEEKKCGNCQHWVWEQTNVFARAIGNCPHGGEKDSADPPCAKYCKAA